MEAVDHTNKFDKKASAKLAKEFCTEGTRFMDDILDLIDNAAADIIQQIPGSEDNGHDASMQVLELVEAQLIRELKKQL